MEMSYWCESCARKSNCYTIRNRPKCFVAITNSERIAEQTEPQTDCDNLINAVVKLDMSREDKFKVIELLEQHCEKCKHYLFTDIDGYYCEHETYGQRCAYEPKTEPNYSEKPNNCDTCKHNKLEWYSEVCDGCSKAHSNYEPKDEPQTDRSMAVGKRSDATADKYNLYGKTTTDEPQTDCAWK